VSCQALEGEPLHGALFMAAMARAAVAGGAAGIRANGPADVAAIRAALGPAIPLIGLWKQPCPGLPVYITPTVAAARALREAGADIIAVDATARPRPEGGDAAGYLRLLRRALDCPVMADVATLEEGLAAAGAGAAVVATTMAGYTSTGPPPAGPDFALLAALVAALGHQGPPVVAEGRIGTPAQARRALDLGAWAVVVGSAITRPQEITARFARAVHGPPSSGAGDA
jgi:N-acylglucosamine-6-phosphate 2-epimerase